MKAKTQVKWLSCAVVICLALISLIGIYTWQLNKKLSQFEVAAAASLEPSPAPLADFIEPEVRVLDPWSNDWSQLSPFTDLQQRMDRMMERMNFGFSTIDDFGLGLSSSSPEITMEETDEEYKVVVSVPEGQEVELNTELSDGVLTVSGTVKNQTENMFGPSLGRAMSTSQFSQSMTFSSQVDESGLVVDHADGEIVVRVPKTIG